MKKKLHFNKPQLRSLFVSAPTEVLIAGRGTGKTEGVLAPKVAQCYFGTMPRGTGVFLGSTYNQLLTKTFPAMIAGLERLGYHKDIHYIIGKKPTDKWIKTWNWKGPYRPPLDYKYFVSWWNGAGAHMVSQDRAGSANGITIDWFIGDEAKLLNYERLKTELLPANRGVIPSFAGNIYHHGYTLTSDMPVGSGGQWLLDYEKTMDKEAVKYIWQLQTAKYDLIVSAKKNRKKNAVIELKKQISVIDQELYDARKGLLYYHEASTLDNIHGFGVDAFKQQLRDATQFDFDTQILNIRPLKLQDGFYPDFEEELHGYFANDNSFLEGLNYDFDRIHDIDCRRDSDVRVNEPLHISLDYNRRIHPLVVLQEDDKEIRVLKGLHSKYPLKLKAAVEMFCKYYRYHKNKYVYYWYDHTAVGDDNETKKCDEVINVLQKHGWLVKRMYIGQAPAHESKYRMWGHLLTEDGIYPKRIRFNRENCSNLITSINKAEAELKKEGFGKNKKPEQDPLFPAEDATHYSDALDTPIYGMLDSKIKYGRDDKGGGGIVIGSN